MTHRKKTALVFVLAYLITIGIMAAMCDRILYAGFTRVEADNVSKNVARLEGYLADDRDDLAFLARDYAYWTETWDLLAESPDPQIIENYYTNNMSFDNLTYLKLFAFFVTDVEGNLAYGRMLPPTATALSNADSAAAKFGNPDTLQSVPISGVLPKIVQDFISKHQDLPPTGARVAYCSLAKDVYEFCVVRLLKSDGSGPSRGWACMVRPINELFLKRLGERTGMKPMLTAINPDTPPLPQIAIALKRWRDNVPNVEELDESFHRGYAMLTCDTPGQREPVAILQADFPRDVRAQAVSTLRTFLVATSAIMLMMFLFLYLLVVRFAIQPRMDASRQINAAEETAG